jgi:ABC-type transport system, involved in lipoprotein release, permease component
MYIVRNALRNIVRSKARNILIGVIVLVIATSCCIALSIKHSAAKTESQGMSSLNITGQITIDREKLIEQAQSGSGNIRDKMTSVTTPTLAELKKYAGSPYVSGFYYTVTSSVNSGEETFVPVDTNSTSNSSSSNSTSDNSSNNGRSSSNGESGGGGFMGRMGTQGDFSLIGYSDESAMTDFISGVCQISDGSMIDLTSSDMKCIITNELAAYNNLKIGDTIQIANPNSSDEIYTLTINGIYTNSSSGSTDNGMLFSTSGDPANRIIISVGTLNDIANKSASVAQTTTNDESGITSTTALRTQLSGTYVFVDVNAFDSFQTDVRNMGLDDTYTVTSNNVSSYEQSLVPLKNLSEFASVFLLIVLLIGAIILVILNIFNIHERKYEVGVLTAIGMKKGKVALQYIIELFAVTISFIIIGTAIGAVVSVPTANALLASQVSSQQSQSQQIENNFGRNQTQGSSTTDGMTAGGGFFRQAQGSVVNYISDINAATDMTVVAELLGIGILLTILSSCAAVFFIMRYEPLKILTSRT